MGKGKDGLLFIFTGIATFLSVATFLLTIWNSFNFNITHTTTEPADTPGMLVSARNGLFWWATQVVHGGLLLMVLSSTARLVKRESAPLKYLQVIFAIVGAVSEIIVLVAYFILLTRCNNEGYNPCNDVRYCCVHGSLPPFATVNPSCPVLLAPCDPPAIQEELRWNPVFFMGFVLSWVGLILALLLTLLGLFLPADETPDADDESEGEIVEGLVGLQATGANYRDNSEALQKKYELQRRALGKKS